MPCVLCWCQTNTESICGVACMQFFRERKPIPYAWFQTISNIFSNSNVSNRKKIMAAGFAEWEDEITKYEGKYGEHFDADLKLAILSEVASTA